MAFVGMDDSFGESGMPAELMKKYHLDAASDPYESQVAPEFVIIPGIQSLKEKVPMEARIRRHLTGFCSRLSPEAHQV